MFIGDAGNLQSKITLSIPRIIKRMDVIFLALEIYLPKISVEFLVKGKAVPSPPFLFK